VQLTLNFFLCHISHKLVHYIFQKSLFFLNSFELFSRKFLTAQRNALFTQNLTKPIFEFVGVLGLLTLLTILMFERNSLGTIISTVGLFLVASIRLLPCVNKIVLSMQGIKYFKVSLNRIIDEFKTINQSLKLSNNTKKLEFNNEMIFKNVSFSYKEKDKEVLKNLNFKIEKNKILAKKNLISKEEINKDLKLLQVKFNTYKKNKIKEFDKLKTQRNRNIVNFLNLINPIIEKYMIENSIYMLMDKKNVFIASKDYDITNNLIELIDNQIKTIEIK